MRQFMKIGILVFVGCLVIGSSYADDKNVERGPWEKMSLKFGGFLSNTNTSFRIGTAAGVDLDVEELLGLDVTNATYRLSGLWRFTDNRRHRLDLSWFRLHRSGENAIGQGIEVPGKEGENFVTIPAGTKVESYFNMDLYQAAYSYSFLQDDRIDLAGSVGLYLMPLDFGFKATGIVDGQGNANFTAPLPTLGFRMDIVLAPKWYFRGGTQVFYLEYENYRGSILATQGAFEFVPWRHFGIGLGVDALKMQASADGEDIPGVNFKGDVEFGYTGINLYGRILF